MSKHRQHPRQTAKTELKHCDACGEPAHKGFTIVNMIRARETLPGVRVKINILFCEDCAALNRSNEEGLQNFARAITAGESEQIAAQYLRRKNR